MLTSLGTRYLTSSIYLAMKRTGILLYFFLRHLLVANVFGQDRTLGLRDIADDQLSVERSGSFEIGFAAHNNFWLGGNDYPEIAAQEFSILTPENQMKMKYLQPEEGVYNFEEADQHVRFAEENNMLVHGHALVWFNQLPDFVLEKNWNRETLLALMTDHIHTVVGHYRGKVAVWDVCNEVFTEMGGLRNTIWRDVIGTEYIDIAFRLAREADPDAVLLLNDFNVEQKNMKSNRMYNFVKGMIRRGVPIDAIGIQGHLTVGFYYDFCSVAANMQRFADLGLDIYITELDVAIRVDDSESQLATQAELYEKMTSTCLEQPACRAVQTWGFTDRVSWVPSVKPGFGMALPFDKSYEAKPAYFAIQSAMMGGTATSSDQCGGGLLGSIIRFVKKIFGLLRQLFFMG